MKSIGFKNFRKFVEFPELEMSEMTFLVGANNSGKSTLVKSILLILDYLRVQQRDKMHFDKNTLNDINIVTFGRALNNSAETKEISFNCRLGDFSIEIKCKGEEQNTFASVTCINITNNESLICLEINYQTNTIAFELKTKYEASEKKIEAVDIQKIIRKSISDINKQLKSATELKDTIKLQTELYNQKNKLKRSANYVSVNNLNSEKTRVEFPLTDQVNANSKGEIFKELIDDFIRTNKNLMSSEIIRKDKAKFNDLRYIDQHSSLIDQFSIDLTDVLFKNRFIYLAAHSSKQSALFSVRDKDNALSATIHEYYQLGLADLSEGHKFIRNWMKEFMIGDDFKIELIESEAYTFSVLFEGKWVYLGDKGMGSIQVMTLILQMATIISKYSGNTEGCLVMVEEPELNLHPKLQSLLVDLFMSINQEYKIRFIIETHSEYIIRKTQVLVANSNYKDQSDVDDNVKFKVYYFPENNPPYSMGYMPSGRFIEKFEDGFFDEAGKWHMELIKKERGL